MCFCRRLIKRSRNTKPVVLKATKSSSLCWKRQERVPPVVKARFQFHYKIPRCHTTTHMWLSFTCHLRVVSQCQKPKFFILYKEDSSIVREVESMAIWHVVVRVTVGRKIITFPRFPSRRGKLLKLFVSSPVLPSSSGGRCPYGL